MGSGGLPRRFAGAEERDRRSAAGGITWTYFLLGMWMAFLSAARTASCTDSDTVGWQ